MPGHHIPKSVRLKLRAGQSVRVYRGWHLDDLPPRPASAVRQISPTTGLATGEIVVVPTTQLRLAARPPWRVQRPVRPC